MQQIKKILVVRLSSIGDIILTTPLLRHLNRAFPQAQIDYCTKSPFTSLLESNPRIASVYTIDDLPAGSYDLVADLQNNVRSRRLVHALHAVHVVRYHKENWKKWLLVQYKLNMYGSYRSVAERYLDALKGFSVAGDQQGCELYLSQEDQAYADVYVQQDRKTLALCFGAKHFTKRYPARHFAALLSLLAEKQPLHILLLGGKEDAHHATELMQLLPANCRSMVTNLAGSCTLMQTAALLARCDAVLCNDTGLMHIASAFGRQLFVLFGSSSAAFGFLPYHTPYTLFEVEGLQCRPCSHIGREDCPKKDFRCMNDLPVALIARSILNYLAR